MPKRSTSTSINFMCVVEGQVVTVPVPEGGGRSSDTCLEGVEWGEPKGILRRWPILSAEPILICHAAQSRMARGSIPVCLAVRGGPGASFLPTLDRLRIVMLGLYVVVTIRKICFTV